MRLIGRFVILYMLLSIGGLSVWGQCSPDVVPPTTLCQNASVTLDSSGRAPLPVSLIDAGTYDNCILNTVTLSRDTLNCGDLGQTTVTLYAVDLSGNTDSCSATVTVTDSILPVAHCRDITVQLSTTRDYFLTAVEVDSNSFDNCGLSVKQVYPQYFNCSDLGSHTILYTVEDPAGHRDSCQAQVNLVDTLGNGHLPINIGSDTTICDGDLLFLQADPGYASYTWSTGANTPDIFVGSADVYVITVGDTAGCTGRDSLALGVNILASAHVRPVETPFICLFDTLEILADSGYATYTWSTGASSQNISVTQEGWYYLTVTDTLGCSRTDSLEIIRINQPGPNPVVTPGPNATLCAGDTLLLDAGPGYFAYRWSTGWTGRYLPVTAPGQFDVVCFNGFGCWGRSNMVEAIERNAPQPSITFVSDSLYTDPWSSYQWYLNGNLIPNATNQYLLPQSNGIYRVEVSDAFGCIGLSDTLWILTGQIDEMALSLEIYPNPSSGRLELLLPGYSQTDFFVSLWDARGKALGNWNFRSGATHVLDLGHVPAGVYILQVEQGDQKAFRKLVIRP